MKTVRRSLLSVALLLSLTTATRAADPAIPVVRASIGSFDAVQKLTTDLQLPLPDLKELIEQQFPFLGAGSVDGSKPFGIVAYGSDDFPMQSGQTIVFAIPVLPGKATADSPAFADAKPDAQPGAFSIASVHFRRTANFLLFENVNSAGVLSLAESMLTDDYKKPGVLASIFFDMKAMREAAPNSYKASMDEIRRSASAASGAIDATDPVMAANLAGRKAGQEVMLAFIDKLESLSMSIGRTGDTMHLTTALAPFDAPAVKPMPRPVFPEGTLFQMHVVYPNAQWASWADNVIDLVPATVGAETPEQFAAEKTLFKRVLGLTLRGDAFSFAMSMQNNKPIAYVVTQLANNVDYATEIKDLVATSFAHAKELHPNAKQMFDVSTIAVGAKTVTRVTVTTDTGSAAYIDAIQDGRVIYYTFSENKDGHYVEQLATLGMKGMTNSFCTGTVNLEAVAKAIPELNNGQPAPAAAVWAEQFKKIAVGQSIEWSIETGQPGKAIALDVRLPFGLVRDISKMLTGAGQ